MDTIVYLLTLRAIKKSLPAIKKTPPPLRLYYTLHLYLRYTPHALFEGKNLIGSGVKKK